MAKKKASTKKKTAKKKVKTRKKRTPKKMPPPKSCDSQFHVLGDPERYPTRPGAAYEMPSATWDRALHVHETLGIERGIIVQTTTYGADHQVVLDGLAAMGPNYKGCANALVFNERDDASDRRAPPPDEDDGYDDFGRRKKAKKSKAEREARR